MSTRSATRRRLLELASIAVALCLLAWTLRDVSWAACLDVFRSAHLGWLAAAVGCALLPFPARVMRWRTVLRRGNDSLSFRPLWHATLVGFMANNLLPARLGEWVRAVLARELTGLSISAGMMSIFLLRVMDFAFLLTTLVAVVVAGALEVGETGTGPPSLEKALATSGIALFSICAALGFAMFAPEETRRWVVKLLLLPFPVSWQKRATGIAHSAREGLSVLRSPWLLATALAWTGVIWSVNALAFLAAARALGFDLSILRAFATQAVVAFGIALIPTPGFFGAFEAAVRLTLDQWGIEPTLASAYAIAAHLVFFVPITILGLASLVLLRIRPGRLRADAAEASRR